jgi:OOP family OmpA-OmpF porin
MHSASRQIRVLSTFALAGALLLSGCATKKYVREQIAAVDTKVGEVSKQTKENAEKIDAVDVRARQGITDAAQTAATGAQTTATGAQTSATTANNGVTAANTRITTVENRINGLNIDRYTAGPITTVNFKVGSAVLDDNAKKALDGIASQVASLNQGFLVEIQGFASSEGTEAQNVPLSNNRADAVQRYLVGKNVPLFRISKAGLGVEKPVGDNKTKEGKEQNRRVEVRVMRLQ